MSLCSSRCSLARVGSRRALIDEGYFAEEMRLVMGRNWVWIGFEHDVAALGDLYPIDFGGLPLLLARDQNGGITGIPQRVQPPWRCAGQQSEVWHCTNYVPISSVDIWS